MQESWSKVSLRLRPWPNGSIFRSIFYSTTNRAKNRAVWPPCWVSRVMLSEVWFLSKKSSKRTVVEWKSSRLVTLSRKPNESIRSSVSLAYKYKWWKIFLADTRYGSMSRWKVERKVEGKIESFRHTCSTTLKHRSTLRSNVEGKMEWKIDSFGKGLRSFFARSHLLPAEVSMDMNRFDRYGTRKFEPEFLHHQISYRYQYIKILT